MKKLPYILNRDLFQPGLYHLEQDGRLDECWTHHTLCNIIENATENPGEHHRHRALMDKTPGFQSRKGETLEAFCLRIYLNLTQQKRTAPKIEIRSMGPVRIKQH